MKKLFFAVLLTLLASGLSFSEEIIMVFSDFGYPPFYLSQYKNEPVNKGMFIDFLNEFMDEYPQYQIKMIANPRKRMDLMMTNGTADAFSLNNPMFSADAADFLWTEPIWHTMDTVIVLPGNTLDFNGPEDLYGLKIGKILGNGYGEYDKLFKDNIIERHDTRSDIQLILLLNSGRIDGMFGNIHVVPYIMKQNGYSASDYKFANTPIFEFDLQIKINKSKVDFHNDMNSFIKKAKATGILERIENKWLE
ncbi:MAG: amino acid ABC transporter substrate-binding protein [Deltaproteobacteria bacterium]|nr:amino acid ABC transporter substrate-binding protein [Deltaproteobacteria bacterium]